MQSPITSRHPKESAGKPQVTVSCGTKFHSDQVAYQLDRHSMLDTVLTSHPAKYYLNRVPLKKSKVSFLPPVFLTAYGVRKIFGPSSRLAGWLNYRLPLVYDKLATRSLKATDVLLTWAWSGLNTIRKTKQQGGVAIVEECGSFSRFQNELLADEYSRLGLTFTSGTPQFIIDRQWTEALEADYLLCPSKHVAASFIKYGIPSEKCKVIPYGANVSMFQPKPIEKSGFRILFVGTVGIRKGLIYLFQALELLSKKADVSCTVIGGMEEAFKPIFERYRHLVEYIPHVPHHDLATHYSKASVFVFPSLDEGMALVQLEALACGLPVICTSNSGGDSVVEDGNEGFVVPIRDPQALADKIALMAANSSMVERMSNAARTKAVEFSWERYGDKLTEFITAIHAEKRENF